MTALMEACAAAWLWTAPEQQMQRAAAAAAAAAARHHSLGWLDLSSYFARKDCVKRQQHRHQHWQVSKFEHSVLQLIRSEAKASCQPPLHLPSRVRALDNSSTCLELQHHIEQTAAAANDDAAVTCITLESMPFGVRRALSARGIIALWDWQVTLLANPSIICDRRNALVCLPSGSGKSVAADLLLLRTVLTLRRCALLALPYQSGVQEKVQTYEAMVLSTDLWVDAHDGLSPFPPLPSRPTLCVCT